MVVRVECKHLEAAKYWATLPGSPREVAERLIISWNKPPSVDDVTDYNFHTYPKTSEFRDALTNLIQAAREKSRAGNVETIPDGQGDDLYRVCRRCNRWFLS